MISLLTWARLGSRPAFSVSRARAELELDLVPRPLPRPRPSAVVEVAAASCDSPPPCFSSRLEDLGLLSSEDMSPRLGHTSSGSGEPGTGTGSSLVNSDTQPWPPVLTLRTCRHRCCQYIKHCPYFPYSLLPSWILYWI